MKKINNLYNKINDIVVIMNMYDEVVAKNMRNKRKLLSFDDYYTCNINNIKKTINSNNYVPGKYNIFIIREPKLRIIMSQSVKDKIINHLVAQYFLVNVFDKTLIKENCATRINKGSHYALSIFKNYLNICRKKYQKFYLLKFDIAKYFYNIDHDIVKELIRKKIKDKKVLRMLDVIIDSTNYSYVNRTIISLKEREKKRVEKIKGQDKLERLAEIDRLPLYRKGKGLQIGNMTSQVIATFYLNELDHYIKEELGIKYYVRYMDDAILIHEDKEYLKYCLSEIEKILRKYKLELNRKTKIYSCNEEVEFLGFRFGLRDRIMMKITNKTKKNLKKKMKKIYNKYEKEDISYDKLRSVRDSYMGHLNYGTCHNLTYQYLIKDSPKF